MCKGPRRLGAPASPWGHPGPSLDKAGPALLSRQHAAARVSESPHLAAHPAEVWHATSLTTGGVAGPAAGPLGTPATETTSIYTGSDDFYDNYDYEPPIQAPAAPLPM